MAMAQAIDDSNPHFCRSFKPLVSRASRVLILGSMPGPEALRKQQYYGFAGNHFWKVLPVLFKEALPTTYEEKIKLVKRHGLALWDVIGTSAFGRAALDEDSIRNLLPNDIPGLLKRYRIFARFSSTGNSRTKRFSNISKSGSRFRSMFFRRRARRTR